MLEYIATFLAVTKEIKKYAESREEVRDLIYEAVEAIHRAANRTRALYNTPGFDNSRPNTELSELWLSAASKVRRLRPELYNRLLAKANFWSDPLDWTPESVRKTRIFLDDILEDTEQLLND